MKRRKKTSASAADISATKHASQAHPGRPKGKHSDERYTQMTCYVPKDLRNKVKMRLFEQGMEFSTLVESLLRDWLMRG